MEYLDKVVEWVTSAAGMSATLAVIVEFVLRLIPSTKPLSILHLVAEVVKKVGGLCGLLGDLLDKILPQKVIETPK